MNIEIVDKYYHSNGQCAPFIVAIVDDPANNDTKLVIMFDEEEFTAVLSLDTLIESEDVAEASHRADKYEAVLRKHLWNIEEQEYSEDSEDEDY